MTIWQVQCKNKAIVSGMAARRLTGLLTFAAGSRVSIVRADGGGRSTEIGGEATANESWIVLVRRAELLGPSARPAGHSVGVGFDLGVEGGVAPHQTAEPVHLALRLCHRDILEAKTVVGGQPAGAMPPVATAKGDPSTTSSRALDPGVEGAEEGG